MTFYKFLEFTFYWLFVISNILASFIVGGILYYVYKYYRHYVDSEKLASEERADILAQLTELKAQLQPLQSLQGQLPQLFVTLSEISETVKSFKNGLADQVRLSQQDYDDLFKEFEPVIQNAVPAYQKLHQLETDLITFRQRLETELNAFRQHFDKTMAQF
jgi:chromosome segregation ATPase